MSLSDYQLLAQVHADRNGVAYRARRQNTTELVEIRVLTNCRADDEGRPQCMKRLRLAALLQHDSARQVIELNLDGDPPFVVLDVLEGKSLFDARQCTETSQTELVGNVILQTAAVLAAAHRIGLTHSELNPSTIKVVENNHICLDFTRASPDLPHHQSRDREGATIRSRDREGATIRSRDREGVGPPNRSLTVAAPSAVALNESCMAPEVKSGNTPGRAADVFSFGAVLNWLLFGGENEESSKPDKNKRLESPFAKEDLGALRPLIDEMLNDDPDARPAMPEVVERLTTDVDFLFSQTVEAPPAFEKMSEQEQRGRHVLARRLGQEDNVSVAALPAPKSRLGRYRLLEKIGEGGMGTVYRAEDETDGMAVAIKILRADLTQDVSARRRFQKEARLLAEVNNPYVTNLIEVNEDDGVHYLVMEYVAGRNVSRLLTERQKLAEPVALSIVSDVCRALMDAHKRGIIHRDIKPGNILLVGEETETSAAPRVKLSDFGMARHVVESESLSVTKTGAVLGTPLYMSPEQCTGSHRLDPRSDVYALGATLFHMLAGQPPFLGETPLIVINKHCNDSPPLLKNLNPAASDGVCQIIEKTLAKQPGRRYPGAEELFLDLQRLLRGEPTTIVAHPRLPACEAKKILNYEWSWDLKSPPEQLWTYVSNTERFNRAIHLPAVEFTTQTDKDGKVERFGKLRAKGMTLSWREHPFEWIETRRFGVLREYSQGPLKWLTSVVELHPLAAGGTRLLHRIRVQPQGLLGRLAAAVEIGFKSRRAIDRVYRRIDAALTGQLGASKTVDPFEAAPKLSSGKRRRLNQLLDRLMQIGVDLHVVESVGDFIASAPAQEVARIRPLALARRLGLDSTPVVNSCLHGAREGLLDLFWDILCPVCRIPSEIKESLRDLGKHNHCEACNLDFDLDFANSVEMVFRAHPSLRDVETGTYCIGGPVHSPHVVVQLRVAAGERMELDLALAEGAYRLRGPQLSYEVRFRVQPSARQSRLELALRQAPPQECPPSLQPDRQVVALTNDTDQELLIRVERAVARDDALTAARASSYALFRELFPNEVLAPGQLVNIAHVTMLATELVNADTLYQSLGDAQAFALIHEHLRLLEQQVRAEGGTLVKTLSEGMVAVFPDAAAAVRAGLRLQTILGENAITGDLQIRVGIHRGPAMAVTVNDRLDYFGTTVKQLLQLPSLVQGGETVLTHAAASDPGVDTLLHSLGLEGQILPSRLPGLPENSVQCLIPRSKGEVANKAQ